MSTLTFNKDAGTSLFGNISQTAPDAENLKASELLNFVKKLGLKYKNINLHLFFSLSNYILQSFFSLKFHSKLIRHKVS